MQTRESTTYIWQLLNPLAKANKTRSWNSFAKHLSEVPPQAAQEAEKTWPLDDCRSTESWHYTIHGLVGTGNGFTGHMGDPTVASFDPLFWLHHNNIERLLCLYQALYPNNYVPSSAENAKDPFTSDNALTVDSPLYPFIKDSVAKECFTSADVRHWKKSGFAMPGDQDLTAEGQLKVEQYLRDTYYW